MDSNNQMMTISIEDLKIPVGYRLAPKDSTVITLYLIRKILNNRPLPTTAIKDIVFYNFDPDQLPIDEFSAYCRHNEAYFFTRVVPGRSTMSGGQWKVSGPDVPVMVVGQVVGFKTCFVFYSAGDQKNSTNWTMFEYRVNPALIPANSTNEILKSKINTFVICKVRYRDDKNKMDRNNQTFQTVSIEDVKLPLGFRFVPTHTELIRHYLNKKIWDEPLPSTAIIEYIDFYDIDPDQLPISDQFLAYDRDKEGYGFTRVVPERTTKSGGHWKASGQEVPVMGGCAVIGFKTNFVYYSAREEKRTNWTMCQYRVNPDHIAIAAPNVTLKRKIDTLVICKVKYKDDAENSSSESDSSEKNENKKDWNNHTFQTISTEDLELLPGFRFRLKDPEVIRDYLINKILNRPLPTTTIKDIFFYDIDPELLPLGDDVEYPADAYFFTQVVEGRTTRTGGHWKASGSDVSIMHGDQVIGFKSYFVFYSAGEEKSSNWTMYEYRVNPGLFPAESTNETLKSKIDTSVICNVHYKEDERFSPSQSVQNEETMDNETDTSSRSQSDQSEISKSDDQS
ncbi:hypothetical protein LWI29_033890 [Acer saccharum]|uniref:NAC domain-containing protein n=1 Tax=Acer saccharum TaxID=4024 RepID=A0AA39REV0_ACESA|nr:hypothetical protein LWI29_033890 [Acer saccharum]